MNTFKKTLFSYKFIFFLAVMLGANFALFKIVDDSATTHANHEVFTLVDKAQTLFDDQINVREWNDQYDGGVYVKPLANQEPNPYLADATLKTESNQTLIRVNHAWMTRQLSELLKSKGYSFHATSLNPINPHNIPNGFEKRALKIISDDKKESYYEFNALESRFYFMGALKTTQKCLECHSETKIGDIRGGISVSLDAANYQVIIDHINENAYYQKIMIVLFMSFIIISYFRVLAFNEVLEKRVKDRTAKIQKTTEILQNLLNINNSLAIVTNAKELIYTNETILKLLGYESMEDFKKEHNCVCEFFVDGGEEYLMPQMGELNWVEYLLTHQNEKNLKAMFVADEIERVYVVRAKTISKDGEKLYLVIFDEITDHLNEKAKLEEVAFIDSLTSICNRRRFDELLNFEFSYAKETRRDLSLLFIDIDRFKKINDTYGHDEGDDVLKNICTILKQNIRKNDILARWGGEEFVILLPLSGIEDAYLIAQKLRVAVESYHFSKKYNITISIGISIVKPEDEIKDFVGRADRALYFAKNSGRNRVKKAQDDK